MSKLIGIQQTRHVPESEAPAALAGDYLRSFMKALESFDDFEAFLDCLKKSVGEDAYLNGSAELVNPLDGQAKFPDFDNLLSDETVVAVAGRDANHGYLKYSGRKDLKLFGAEDLHLLGSIAGFVGVLIQQAKQYRKKSNAERMLNYLINQLPLGVVCFDSGGQLIVESKLAQRVLGDSGIQALSEKFREDCMQSDRVQLHFEVDGALVYCEGRSLSVAADEQMFAFVVYEMSSYRAQLMMELEKQAYRSESRGIPVVIVVLESNQQAGYIYGQAKDIGERLQLKAAHVQPIDAYRCVMIFENRQLSSVRYLLKQKFLEERSVSDLRVGLLGYERSTQEASPADRWLNRAMGEMRPVASQLLPALIVMDPYPAVVESLSLLLQDRCQLLPELDVDAVIALIQSGQYDGVFFDLDRYTASQLKALREVAVTTNTTFRFYFCTCKRRSMIEPNYFITINDVVLQKPFLADQVSEVIARHFDLA